MILIRLASIAVPLDRELSRLQEKHLPRGAVQDKLKRIAPADANVSQQVSVGKDLISIHLISTGRIPDAEVVKARADLMLSVDAVASKRELADLMEPVAQPAPCCRPKGKERRRNPQGTPGQSQSSGHRDLAVVGRADSGLRPGHRYGWDSDRRPLSGQLARTWATFR